MNIANANITIPYDDFIEMKEAYDKKREEVNEVITVDQFMYQIRIILDSQLILPMDKLTKIIDFLADIQKARDRYEG